MIRVAAVGAGSNIDVISIHRYRTILLIYRCLILYYKCINYRKKQRS